MTERGIGWVVSIAFASVLNAFAADDEAVYRQACMACHGVDGRSASREQRGFALAPPDFTDCSFASREGDPDWLAVVAQGGPARAFSPMMPAFRDALTQEEQQQALDHVRTFCTNPDWPRGELNLPRPIHTTKAFPEDEVVVAASYDSTAGHESYSATFYYEKRFGARNQFELILPYKWLDGNGPNADGFGDAGLALKRVLYHSLPKGCIVSVGGEVFLPTGDETRGLGSGTVLYEPYLAYGQILPANFFLQAQLGAAIPHDDTGTGEKAFGRAALGYIYNWRGHGRRWSPMVELVGENTRNDSRSTDWDVVPQLQVTLSTRQHVRLAFGARIPATNTGDRDTLYTTYLLWDWFDGGLLEGW